MKTTTPWQSTALPKFSKLAQSKRYDVVVIGGGITGITAALALALAKKRVCLLERRSLAGAETGHTTAHLTYVTDTRLSELCRTFGDDGAQRAWMAGAAALDHIRQWVHDLAIDCEYRHVPGYLHAPIDRSNRAVNDLSSEAETARRLGFEAEYVARVPVVDQPGVRYSNQALIHPRKYLGGLVAKLASTSCDIFEQSAATEVQEEPLTVVANGCRVRCAYVVIATHVPLVGERSFLGATLLQSKLAAYSTYAVRAQVDRGRFPSASFWDTSNPYHYLRIHPGARQDLIIYGGEDHKTGQDQEGATRFRRLEQHLLRLAPGAVVDRRWSGQVLETNDGLPLIGETSPQQFVATGYAGNGMTFGTLAGLMARDAVLGRENPWSELFAVTRKKLKGGAARYLRENLDYPYHLIQGRLSVKHHSPRALRREEGEVMRLDGESVACSRDAEGHLHQVSAVCTHMGCIVHWNSTEGTWDCPCHGSRFSVDGAVLAGPAETPLSPIASQRTDGQHEQPSSAPRQVQPATSPRSRAPR